MFNNFDSALNDAQKSLDITEFDQPSRFTQSPLSQSLPLQSKIFTLESMVNPLVTIAAPLLSFATQLTEQPEVSDLLSLHQSLSHEIKVYEIRAQVSGYRPPLILAGRYFICSLLDEIILNRPWKNISWWQTHTLLNTFQRNMTGDERFFLVLERSAEDPTTYIDVLELGYICLSLGFRGKYRQVNQTEKFAEIVDNLYELICQVRGEFPQQFFVDTTNRKKNKKIRWRLPLPPTGLTFLLAGLLSAIIFFSYYHKLNELIVPTEQAIKAMGQTHA